MTYKSRQPKIRTVRTPEGIAKVAAAAGPCLAGHSKVKLCQLLRLELESVTSGLSLLATSLLLGLKTLG